ncbi:MAG: capsular biosynthesis protein [Bacillota bacterium]
MKDRADLIIPSATLVPQELQNIGKLPGIIYPINQRIVFDYIYDQYKNEVGQIDVICHQERVKIHRRLSSYKDSKIRIKDLELLEDLGHTLYFALEGKESPVFINFADTIIMDNVFDIKADTIFYSEEYISEAWTYFEVNDGILTSLIDKQKSNSTSKHKLFVGLFYIAYPQEFRKCLVQSFVSDCGLMSTFYYALQLYSKRYKFDVKKVSNWFDIGHADTYYNSKLEVKAREFNHITIDRQRGILRKTSDDKDKFIGEILWYLKLPSDVEYARPRIFSHSTSYENPYVEMEYYAYHTIHEMFLYGDLSYQQWIDIFDRIKFVCNDFKRYSVSDTKIKSSLEEMYLTKTIQRFEKLKKDVRFSNLFIKSIIINNVEYKSLSKIIDILSVKIPEMLFDIDKFNIIHGDLCFANIMVDSNISFIKMIDPRGKFGSFDIYGDRRYELAKLMHSIDGKYDYIIKDLFDIEYDTECPNITYSVLNRKREYDIYDIFTSVFKDEIGEDLKKIELIEALLFLSMIPLHGESLDHQMAMLATGIEILDRVIDIKY